MRALAELDLASLNADFRGRENNQPFRGRTPRFLGELAISANRLSIDRLSGPKRRDRDKIYISPFHAFPDGFQAFLPVFKALA